MLGKPLASAFTGLIIAVTPIRLGAQQVSAPDFAGCWAATAPQPIVATDPGCIDEWIDSLRSPVPRHVSRARNALVAAGGRSAVDALRAHAMRVPTIEARLATIAAMATTGSAADVEFLASQLKGPFIGNTDIWPATAAAAVTLRLLRATAARGALASALAQHGSSGFAGRAVTRALADLDRPPCADTVSGELEPELVRIVLECEPEFMKPGNRYRDATTGGTWQFANGRWRLDQSARLDSLAPLTFSDRIWLAPDRRQAVVMVAMRCGKLCGEGWMFRLRLTDGVWRVVGAAMSWVS